MQGAEPVLTRRKPPSTSDGSDSSSSSEEPQIANRLVAHPVRPVVQPQDNTTLLLSIIVALLISATLFTYFYMNLKQAGFIRDTFTRKQFFKLPKNSNNSNLLIIAHLTCREVSRYKCRITSRTCCDNEGIRCFCKFTLTL